MPHGPRLVQLPLRHDTLPDLKPPATRSDQGVGVWGGRLGGVPTLELIWTSERRKLFSATPSRRSLTPKPYDGADVRRLLTCVPSVVRVPRGGPHDMVLHNC